MKKEVVFAILIGLGLGLIVTYGVYRARTALLNLHPGLSASPSPVAGASPNNSLTLLTPDDESVQSDATVKISGTTTADSIVVAFVNNTENIVTADKSGGFSINTQLDPGSNVIAVKAIGEDGNVSEEDRTVIMTSTDFSDTSTASGSATTAGTGASTGNSASATSSAKAK